MRRAIESHLSRDRGQRAWLLTAVGLGLAVVAGVAWSSLGVVVEPDQTVGTTTTTTVVVPEQPVASVDVAEPAVDAPVPVVGAQPPTPEPVVTTPPTTAPPASTVPPTTPSPPVDNG
jgi:hypothetical protein